MFALSHSRFLRRKKARVLPVAPPVLQVDVLVRDVPVPAKQDLPAHPAQLLQVRQERLRGTGTSRLADRGPDEPDGWYTLMIESFPKSAWM
jgi:hypothetical protein